jgi:integrase
MALVRAVLRRACEVWEWIERAPKAPMYQVQSKRIRWLSEAEKERLYKALPEHLVPLVRFSLATGLRQRNACRLEWKSVDLERQCAWIHADQSKNKRPIAVPLNADAMAVLRQCQGKHQDFVFTFHGKPVWWVGTKAWRSALVRAGIEDFRWHDLRHTWATEHANSGTPLNVLQELGGWESPEMVRRYAHYSAAHLLTHAQRIATC